MAMSENSVKVLNYLKEIGGDNVTAADVAAALDLPKKTVDGVFTMSIQKKGLGFREEAEVEIDDGSHVKVKFLKLTDEGKTFDPTVVAE